MICPFFSWFGGQGPPLQYGDEASPLRYDDEASPLRYDDEASPLRLYFTNSTDCFVRIEGRGVVIVIGI